MKYFIAYKNPTTQYIPVQAEILTPNKVTNLNFPTWRPGRYELGSFAKNIHSFQVLDDQGKKLDVKKTAHSTWEVNTANTSEIKISYKYYGAELNAGSSFMDDLQLYVNPVNLLIYDENQLNEPCTLDLDLPIDFKLACGAPHSNNQLTCANYHELVDSPFIASNSLKKFVYHVKGCSFYLWFQGEFEFNETKVLEDFEKFSRYQLEKFDGFETKTYHFLYQIIAVKAYHGVEHKTSTVIALGPGNKLMNELYDDFLGVSSHELYHVWNVKSIRPIEMYPYDYAGENYTHLGYVTEGVTTYMGDLILCASNVKTFAWYKSELEKLLQRHFDNYGRFNYSVAESSWDTWLDGYVPGAPHRKVSIYNEGALLSFAVDILIRNYTENKASLHDVMNKLYIEFAKKNKGYSADDFFEIIEQISGHNFNTLRKNYYYGTHSFEPLIVEALNLVGLDIKMEKNPQLSVDLLGLKSLPEGDKVIVKAISPGSGAELGGLILEDRIQSINGEEIKGNFEDVLKKHAEGEIYLRVIRMGRSVEILIPHTNKSYYPIYKIIKQKIPSNLSKRIFKSWCGYKYDSVSLD